MIVKGQMDDGSIGQTPAQQFYSLPAQVVQIILDLLVFLILLRQNTLTNRLSTKFPTSPLRSPTERHFDERVYSVNSRLSVAFGICDIAKLLPLGRTPLPCHGATSCSAARRSAMLEDGATFPFCA